ncbi:vasorin-like isoform X2 [Photinus pyralis]|uniref:vasorin-like isoform X2 n=1 Tax=Photinus pyralis TaxID=7054 RepID=UPI0012672603|nr:vasorin-like isoform X2 [Photinus pyralis]
MSTISLFSSEELCSFSKSKLKCMCRYQAQPNTPFPVHSADCTRMSLTEFPKDTHLPSVEDLDLSRNLISTLDHDHNNFESVLLRFLNLSFNKIAYLFQDFFINTPNLSVLDLSHNEIVYLSNANVFRGLGNLTVLKLSFNKLSTLPEDVFRPLKNLEELDLRFNYLGVTLMQHSSFFQLSMGFPRNISKLNLDGVGISKLPNGYFDEGSHLKYLSLSDNPLTEIPLVSSIVEHLDLSGTHITTVSGKHLPYQSLKVLKLNRLKRLEEIEHYAFLNLKSLEELHLSDSKRLRSLPNLAFGILSNDTEVTLKRMHISRTGIRTLNSTYLHLFKKVKFVDLQHNPWDCKCEILWLQQLNGSLHRYDNIRCLTPRNLRTKKIMSLSDKDMPDCFNSYANVQKTLIGIFSILVALLCLLILYLLYLGPFHPPKTRGVGPGSPYQSISLEIDPCKAEDASRN